MSFLESLGLTENATPSDLHAVIERRVRATLEQGLLESQAATEAVNFTKGNPNAWLVKDEPFVARAMADATSGAAFKTEPEPGRAILVAANELGLHDFYDADSAYGYREWSYVSDFTAPDANGYCHRCSLPKALRTGFTDLVELRTLHIARGRYVVQFSLCLECMATFGNLADRVTANAISRVESGDTYVEFETSRTVDLTDKDHGDGDL